MVDVPLMAIQPEGLLDCGGYGHSNIEQPIIKRAQDYDVHWKFSDLVPEEDPLKDEIISSKTKPIINSN